ncbi:MAG: chemotaxis protein CheD [Clostridia bacterium]|nr:chemotaxis protein CheD [Clostridia bacterium]
MLVGGNMELIVGIGECAVSNKEADSIRTFALASCVAVTAYSPLNKVAGMVHVALPFPTDIRDINSRPCYFATTGLPVLINKMCKLYGCLKGELKIGLYGGANSINNDDVFNIGKRNIEALVCTLDSLCIKIHSNETGGILSRTLEMNVATGIVKVFTHPIHI